MADLWKIDEHALDSEWLKQARLTWEAGVREADARHVHAQAKARLEVAEARLKFKIKNDPGTYGLGDRPTVQDVAAATFIQTQYQDALREVNEAKYALDVAGAEVSAMIDRRKALERLVELIALNYYGERGPKPLSRDSREVREEMDRRERHDARRRDS